MSVKKEGDLSNGLPPDELSGGGDPEPRPKHDLDSATELKLLDAAFLGDMQAFSEIFEHYRPDLYTLCNQRLDDPSLAEDVVQEVFLKALTRLPIFDRNKRIWPWLATIAFRLCTDLQRRRSFTHYSGNIEVSVDTGVRKNGIESHTGSPLDELIASEERVELWKSLDVLPERQRRVFLSFTLDDMSCADIAAAEGISVGLVHVLLFRARKKMRSVHQGRQLPAIVLPLPWLRWKFQRIEERVRPLLSAYSDGFSSACVQAVCLSTVAMMAIATGNSAESFERGDAARSNESVLSATQSRPVKTASLPTALSNFGVPAKAPVEPQQAIGEVGGPLEGYDVPNLTETPTPENSGIYSLAVSPNYENDHTVVAAGHNLQGHVIFASRDGGANWKPQLSLLSVGTQRTMVLSPGYPQDRRIFTLGEHGLQQSDDEGAIFRIVSPTFLGTGLAISPSFGRGESKVLIGGNAVLEYDANTGVTEPTSMSIPLSLRGVYSYINYSPSYISDRTVFVSDNFPDQITYRCKGLVCEERRSQIPGPLTLRLSPRFHQDGLAYAFSYKQLFVSHDGARTFQEISVPLDGRGIEDVAVSWNVFSDPAVFISASFIRRHSVYRSFDAGRSWNWTQFYDIPGFTWGSVGLIVTPTGRLLTAGKEGHIACSEDNGATWRPRCPPEH